MVILYTTHSRVLLFDPLWYSVLQLVHLAHWHLKWLFDIVGVIATIFITIFYLLPLFFILIFVSHSFCLSVSFNWTFFFFFLAGLHSLQDCISLTRDWTQALAVNVPSPNHCTTREFQKEHFILLHFSPFLEYQLYFFFYFFRDCHKDCNIHLPLIQVHFQILLNNTGFNCTGPHSRCLLQYCTICSWLISQMWNHG